VHFTPVMTTPADAKFPACAAKKTCWEIACAQLCGLGHYRMRGFLNVYTAEEFAAWSASQAPVPAAPPAPAAPAPVSPEAAPPAPAH
jgi:heme/copper-type cytochrome/quinol oxidase subunit 2